MHEHCNSSFHCPAAAPALICQNYVKLVAIGLELHILEILLVLHLAC